MRFFSITAKNIGKRRPSKQAEGKALSCWIRRHRSGAIENKCDLCGVVDIAHDITSSDGVGLPLGDPIGNLIIKMSKSKNPKKKVAAKSRTGDTRRPLERIFTIHQRISRGRFPNCRQLAEEIEVTQKTVQRDISFMRNELDLPLEYDPVRHGYFYEKPVSDFPLLKITVEDVVALFLAQRALEPLQGSPLEATLRDSFRRLSSSIPGDVTFQWTDLDDAFSVRESGIVPGDVRLFEKLARAVLERLEIRFDYRKIESDEWEPRSLKPYHIAEVDGGWYVIGHDAMRKARRTFALQRMKAVRVLKTRFLRPPDFKLGDHLGGSFGVWHNPMDHGEHHRIRLRFTGWAARMVVERRWHPSQEIIETGGNSSEEIEMILKLNGFEEISRWILSWGSQVEVLEPIELRAAVKTAIADAGSIYE